MNTPLEGTQGAPLRPLLKIAEVCQALSLSRATVLRLAQDGALLPVRIRKGAVRWRPQDVETYLESLRTPST